MTYKLWEETLLNYLKSLNKEEKEEILSYYREMYNDKHDTGIPESEIVDSFGDPMIAAARIPSAAFLAPPISTSPFSAVPPLIIYCSILLPLQLLIIPPSG